MTEKIRKVIDSIIKKKWLNLPRIFPDSPRNDVFFIDHVICEPTQKPTDYVMIQKIAIPSGLDSYSIVIEITGLSKEETDILFRFKEGEELFFSNTSIEI